MLAILQVLWNLDERGFAATRLLPDGRFLGVQPLLWARAELGIAPREDDGGWSDAWEYESIEEAEAAMRTWDGAPGTEPAGWTRHPQSGRRRPGGDPAKEYILP